MARLDELWNDSGTDTERLVFFSDAVFAIALTLLVIDLRVPEVEDAAALPAALWTVWPNLLSFLISFAAISQYWRLHHHMFRTIERYDKRLLNLNSLFLLGITLQPFATSIVGRYGSQPIGMAIYAGVLTLTGGMLTLMWIHATANHRLVAADLDVLLIRYDLLRMIFAAVLFGISIGLPFIMPPTWVPFLWLLNGPFGRFAFVLTTRRQRIATSAPAAHGQESATTTRRDQARH